MCSYLKSFKKRSNVKKNSKHNLVNIFERNWSYLLAIIYNRLFKTYQSASLPFEKHYNNLIIFCAYFVEAKIN